MTHQLSLVMKTTHRGMISMKTRVKVNPVTSSRVYLPVVSTVKGSGLNCKGEKQAQTPLSANIDALFG